MLSWATTCCRRGWGATPSLRALSWRAQTAGCCPAAAHPPQSPLCSPACLPDCLPGAWRAGGGAGHGHHAVHEQQGAVQAGPTHAQGQAAQARHVGVGQELARLWLWHRHRCMLPAKARGGGPGSGGSVGGGFCPWRQACLTVPAEACPRLCRTASVLTTPLALPVAVMVHMNYHPSEPAWPPARLAACLPPRLPALSCACLVLHSPCLPCAAAQTRASA